MTAQQECSQCLLVVMESTTSLPILLAQPSEFARVDMYLNDDIICSTLADQDHSGSSDYPSGSCSTAVDVVAGKNIELKKDCSNIAHFEN